MWKGNSRQAAIWYDEYPVFINGVRNKVGPKEVKKPNTLNKVGSLIPDKEITKKIEKILS